MVFKIIALDPYYYFQKKWNIWLHHCHREPDRAGRGPEGALTVLRTFPPGQVVLSWRFGEPLPWHPGRFSAETDSVLWGLHLPASSSSSVPVEGSGVWLLGDLVLSTSPEWGQGFPLLGPSICPQRGMLGTPLFSYQIQQMIITAATVCWALAIRKLWRLKPRHNSPHFRLPSPRTELLLLSRREMRQTETDWLSADPVSPLLVSLRCTFPKPGCPTWVPRPHLKEVIFAGSPDHRPNVSPTSKLPPTSLSSKLFSQLSPGTPAAEGVPLFLTKEMSPWRLYL